jgi:hypothetical protein
MAHTRHRDLRTMRGYVRQAKLLTPRAQSSCWASARNTRGQTRTRKGEGQATSLNGHMPLPPQLREASEARVVPGSAAPAPARYHRAIFKFEAREPASNSAECSYNVLSAERTKQMARIPRDEYPKIQRLVDVEGKKVAEVAASYGCTPANIYAILNKARRTVSEGAVGTAPEKPSAPVPFDAEVSDTEGLLERSLAASGSSGAACLDLFGAAAEPGRSDTAASNAAVASVELPAAKAPPPDTKVQISLAPVGASASATSSRTPKDATPVSGASPAKAGRGKGTGIALLMRASDGEEAAHPFRSLEELLSAAKPILRSAARSPEPIWFSIQQVDFDAFAVED